METPAAVGEDAMGDVVKKVIHLVTREHPLTGNQLFDLASQLQRVATHRMIEEHLRKHLSSGPPRRS